jgi:hypothetical protein
VAYSAARSSRGSSLGLFLLLIAANPVMIFFLGGVHWTLPDTPTRYELIS